MKVDGLAQAIIQALGTKTDGQGKPIAITEPAKGRANGIITALKAATVTFAPGTITGTTAAGSPLVNGAGKGGKFVGLSPAKANSIFRASAPDTTSELEKENSAFIAYLLAQGSLFFVKGSIKGTCTSTGSSSGPLAGGQGKPGRLTGVSGKAAAAFMQTQGVFVGPESIGHYDAILDYLKLNLELRYSSGQVTGTCPSGGGPLSAGTATGGKVV